MTKISDIKPADKVEASVYMPYYSEARRKFLPTAIGLYKEKNLEGARKIDGGEDISFVATWNITSLPSDLTRCRMQFDGNAELSYEVMMQTHEFVNILIDVLLIYHRTRHVDFPKIFYMKLLKLD
jgi:hypothetical protein